MIIDLNDNIILGERLPAIEEPEIIEEPEFKPSLTSTVIYTTFLRMILSELFT